MLRSQIGMDWSKEIVKDASIEDLDEKAIKRARQLFSKRQHDRRKAQDVLSKLSDIEVLNKAGITIKGKITRTALLLLGKGESQPHSWENFRRLKRQGLVEGRYPNLFVSFKVAGIVGQKADYIRNKGLNDDICKQLIIKALETMGEASKHELMDILDKALPEVLSENQKSKKVSNLLQILKNEKIIAAKGKNRYAKWFLK